MVVPWNILVWVVVGLGGSVNHSPFGFGLDLLDYYQCNGHSSSSVLFGGAGLDCCSY